MSIKYFLDLKNMDSDIKSRYEKICPRTKWSDEEIIANFFKNSPICETSESNIIVVKDENELNKILEEAGAIPLEDFVSTLRMKL